MSDDPVRTAEFEVDRARSKLIGSLRELLRQFEPHLLMQEAWEKAKDKGADLAEDAVDAVSKRPLTTGAVIAGIVAFLARDSLMNAVGKLATRAKGKSRKRRKAPQKESTEVAE
ncbi:MAG TPA: hypothetical protein VHU79_04705 [Sphingomicrobium sp.]|jgi:hypothetical protein|nr:hypothetical protein [Sphingomicrobium sp.]